MVLVGNTRSFDRQCVHSSYCELIFLPDSMKTGATWTGLLEVTKAWQASTIPRGTKSIGRMASSQESITTRTSISTRVTLADADRLVFERCLFTICAGLRRNPTDTANAASHSTPSSLELGGAAAKKTVLYGKALFFNICPIAMFGATAALLAGASGDARLGRTWG